MLNIQTQKNNSISFKSNFVKNTFLKQVISRATKADDENALHNINRVLNDGKKDEYMLEKHLDYSYNTFGCILKKNNREIIKICLDPSYYGKYSTAESGLTSLDHISIKPHSLTKNEISKELKRLKDQIFNTTKNLTLKLDEISQVGCSPYCTNNLTMKLCVLSNPCSRSKSPKQYIPVR